MRGRILSETAHIVAQRGVDRSSVPQSQARRSGGILALAPVVLLPAPPPRDSRRGCLRWLVKCRLPSRGESGRARARTWVPPLPRLERRAKAEGGEAVRKRTREPEDGGEEDEGYQGVGSGRASGAMLYMILHAHSLQPYLQYHRSRKNTTKRPRMCELLRLTRGRDPTHTPRNRKCQRKANNNAADTVQSRPDPQWAGFCFIEPYHLGGNICTTIARTHIHIYI